MQQLLKGMILVGLLVTSNPLWSQNINTPNKTGPMGLQVNSLTGNLYFSRNDLFISGRRFDLNISFQYNSVNSDLNFGYGLGWSFIYDVRYSIDTFNNKIIKWGDGSEDKYTPNGSGGYSSPKGSFTTFSEYQSGKFVLAEKDGDQYFFDNATHKRLTKMQEPNGNFLNFGYTDSLLTSVANEAGQTISFGYDNKGRLTSVIDALTTPNRTWTYTYDATDHLLQVTDPAGGKFQYAYLINGPMKSITDKNNNVVNIIYYGDATISELIGCNRRISFSYDTTQKVSIATDYVPEGENQVTKYKYTTVNGANWLTSITSNCCGFDKTFEYDNQGNKIKETDANGNTTTYTYDTLGNILTFTDALQQTLKYTYTANFNNVASFTDAKGLVTRMEYDTKGNLTKITEPGNLVTTAAYNSKGEVTNSTDPKGNVYTYTYDVYGNLATVTTPGGSQAILVYDSRAQLQSVNDALGNVKTFEYDILSRMKKFTDPLNQSEQFSYDAMSNVVAVKNKSDENRQFKFDAANRLVEFTNAMGKKTKAGYDALNNINTFTDAEGNKVQFSFDSKNRMKAMTNSEGNQYKLGYDENGNITSMTPPGGGLYQFVYDVLNRVKSFGDQTGRMYQFNYDQNNNIISYTDPTGAITQLEYDSMDRVKQVTDALGNTASIGYDANGNIVSLRDRNNHTSTMTYDSRNRLKTISDNNGSETTISYNAVGQITTLKDANNNTTAYQYDNLRRVTKVIYPNGQFLQFSYDAKNNVLQKIMTDGRSVAYTYDTLNRLIAKTLPDGQIYSYGYDNIGRVTSATNNTGTVQLTYDVMNRLVSETFNGKTIRYQYNVTGRTQSIVYSDSTIVTKTFNERDQLLSVSRNDQMIVTYQYNTAGQLTGKVYGNGLATSFQYDVANRLIGITTGNGVVQSNQFQYDKNQNKTSVQRLNPSSASEQFTYDNGNRIISYKKGIIGGPFSINNTYSYDALGNRTAASLNGAAITYSNNNLNQLTASSGGQVVAYSYDANGNLSFDGRFYKSYDAEKRLIKDSASPSNVISYSYDALGRRVSTSINGDISTYTYAGLQPIEERNAGGDLKAKTIFAGLLMPVLNEKDGSLYYYHQNELNSIEAISTASGQLAERYEYDAWGKQTVYDPAGTTLAGSKIGNRIGFTGQVFDSATGTIKFFYREYNPDRGVFSQRDPSGYKDGMGMYQYVHDNPANGIDILGLEEQSFGDAFLDVAGNYFSNGFSIMPALTDSRAPDVLKSLQVSQKVAESGPVKYLNNPLFTMLLTPVNLVVTVKTFHDTWTKWPCLTDAEAWDGTMSIASGTYNTSVGAYTTYNFYRGYKATMLTEKMIRFLTPTLARTPTAMRATALLGGAESAAGTFSAASNFGKLNIALGGGLAIASFANMGWKWATGETFAETGAHGEGPVADWERGSWQDHADEQTMENFNNQNESGRARDYQRARAKVDKLGSHGPVQREHWNARHPNADPEQKKDCPQNNGGGSQKPGGGKGPDGNAEVISGLDPNEIIGPDGEPGKRWISVKDRLPYTVLFENAKEATAPAKFVKVIVPVQNKMDAAQFELKNFGFNNQSFTVPSSTAAYYQRLDCRDSIGLYVDITAGYDVVKNQFFWEFQSIDPITLLPPANPLKGFLQQQDSTKTLYGHGFVNFSVKPVTNAHTLDSILAKADIVFDTNDTIPTNITHNIIDAVAPTSQLNDLGPNYTGAVPLTWTGADDLNGSGLRHYTLYVSTDGINFNIIRSGITRTDTVFNGTPGSRYYFFVLATDTVGNIETLRPGAIKSTQLGAGLPLSWLYFNGTAKAKDNLLDWATATEQNVKEFLVERSFDGFGFESAGKVKAVGNSNRKVTYQFIDYNVDRFNKKVFYYRLKQIDIDGNSTYSKIVRLTHNLTGVPTIVYPNPTSGYVTIVVGDSKLIGTNALVYDEVGRLIQSVKITANAQTINLATQMNGVYLIKLANKEILRIVKQ